MPPKKTSVKKPPAKADRRGSSTERKGSRKKIDSINWPTADGVPMIQISFTASELIPTGQYANVTVGPATVTRFVPDGDDDHIAEELNKLAEVIEVECIAEQRELVLDSLRADVENQGK